MSPLQYPPSNSGAAVWPLRLGGLGEVHPAGRARLPTKPFASSSALGWLRGRGCWREPGGPACSGFWTPVTPVPGKQPRESASTSNPPHCLSPAPSLGQNIMSQATQLDPQSLSCEDPQLHAVLAPSTVHLQLANPGDGQGDPGSKGCSLMALVHSQAADGLNLVQTLCPPNRFPAFLEKLTRLGNTECNSCRKTMVQVNGHSPPCPRRRRAMSSLLCHRLSPLQPPFLLQVPGLTATTDHNSSTAGGGCAPLPGASGNMWGQL